MRRFLQSRSLFTLPFSSSSKPTSFSWKKKADPVSESCFTSGWNGDFCGFLSSSNCVDHSFKFLRFFREMPMKLLIGKMTLFKTNVLDPRTGLSIKPPQAPDKPVYFYNFSLFVLFCCFMLALQILSPHLSSCRENMLKSHTRLAWASHAAVLF